MLAWNSFPLTLCKKRTASVYIETIGFSSIHEPSWKVQTLGYRLPSFPRQCFLACPLSLGSAIGRTGKAPAPIRVYFVHRLSLFILPSFARGLGLPGPARPPGLAFFLLPGGRKSHFTEPHNQAEKPHAPKTILRICQVNSLDPLPSKGSWRILRNRISRSHT